MIYDSRITHTDADSPQLSMAQCDYFAYYNILLDEDGVAQSQRVTDLAQRFIA
jgi:hypothetical protein